MRSVRIDRIMRGSGREVDASTAVRVVVAVLDDVSVAGCVGGRTEALMLARDRGWI
jgi:hypothetical protein